MDSSSASGYISAGFTSHPSGTGPWVLFEAPSVQCQLDPALYADEPTLPRVRYKAAEQQGRNHLRTDEAPHHCQVMRRLIGCGMCNLRPTHREQPAEQRASIHLRRLSMDWAYANPPIRRITRQ